MAIPNSGPLTLSMLQTEFGGSNPISLSEYYAGGAYVPAGTTGINGAVPSSGMISLSQFYGTRAVYTLDTQTVTNGQSSTSDKGGYTNWYGYQAGMGSISDGTFNPVSNASIYQLMCEYSVTYSPVNAYQVLYFVLTGTYADDGWGSVEFSSNGLVLTRSSRINFSQTGGRTAWTFFLPDYNSIPFLNNGANVTCTFKSA